MKEAIIELSGNVEFGYKFEVDEAFWKGVEEIATVLQPSYNLTIEMQQVGYGLSDFYIGWLRVKKNLQRIVQSMPQFNLAAKLIGNMDKRAPSLFKSPLFLCSVFLDPRIMFTLSDEQKATAAMGILKIQERITETTNANEEEAINNTLDEIQPEFQNQHLGNQNTSDSLLQEISIYETEKPCDIKKPVMEFWENNAQKYHLLRPIADILHAVPSNQTCTERAFSSLSYIRSKHRMSMSAQNLSNVLMIRLNKDIYYLLREERAQQILKA